jgi:probable phosphoglycerate mutase
VWHNVHDQPSRIWSSASLRKLGRNVAQFSHGQFGRVLAARWIGAPVLEERHLALDVASLSILGHESPHPETLVVALWSAAPRSLPNNQ